MDKSGCISVQELKSALLSKGCEVHEENICHLVGDRFLSGSKSVMKEHEIHCLICFVCVSCLAMQDSVKFNTVARPLQINGTDLNSNAKIDYEEFIAATMHESKLSKEELVYQAFQVSMGCELED